MYAKIENNKIKTVSRPKWLEPNGGQVSDDYLKTQGYYIILDSDKTRYSQLKPMSDWVIDDKNKTITKQYYPISNDELVSLYKADKIQQVKEECKRFIYSLYSIEKQLQMSFKYNELLRNTIQETITPEEEAEKIQLENLHAWYKGVIAQSHAMEADIEKLTKYEDIEAYDITFKE